MSAKKMVRAVLAEGGFRRLGADGVPLPRQAGQTDFAALARLTEAEVQARALADPDNPPLSEADWQAAVTLPAKRYIHIGLDEDVLGWFQQAGRGYQTRINAVLRRYVDAQKKTG
jgi:uncharacterized protein (DUF4415 family)